MQQVNTRKNSKRLTISREIERRQSSIVHIYSNSAIKHEPDQGKFIQQHRQQSIDSSLNSHQSIRKQQQKVIQQNQAAINTLNKEFNVSSECSEESILTIQCVESCHSKNANSRKYIESLNMSGAMKFQENFEEELEKEKNNKENDIYCKLADILKLDLGGDDDDYDDNANNNNNQENQNNIISDKIIKKYVKQYQRNPFSDPYYVQLVPLEGLQRLQFELDRYQDRYPFLITRKYLVYASLVFPILLSQMMKLRIYKICMTILILFNVFLFIVVKTQHREDTFQIEQVITILFILEIVMRIYVSGLLFTKNAFFLNMQDVYDFTLIFATAVNLYYPEILMVDISPLRLVTLLFYLGDIFQGLGLMLRALKSSIKFLLESLMIVGLFSLFFSVQGLFLFQRLFNFRCENDNGDETQGWIQCNQNNCYDEGMTCLYSDETPKLPTSFNNILYSVGQILRTITMDDWSWVMFYTMRIFNAWVWVYFLFIIFIGGFFGFNLVIAVLKTHYAETAEQYAQQQEEELIQKMLKENQEKPEKEILNVFDVAFLKYINFFSIIQRYRDILRSKSIFEWDLESETQINKQGNEARTLSAKQKKQTTVQIEEQTILQALRSLTLKNWLLYKFKKLKILQQQINIKKYTDDPLELDILTKLQSLSFSSLQSQVNYTIQQKFDSSNDVLLQLIQIDQALQEQKHFKIERIRKIKLKHTYPNWRHQIDIINKKKAEKSTQQIKSFYPTLKKQNKFKVPAVTKSISIDEETERNSVTSAQKKKKISKQIEQSMQQLKISKKKQKKFVKYLENVQFVYIQGYYLDYQEVRKKINTKIPIIKDESTSYKFKYRKIREREILNGIIDSRIWSGKDVLTLNAHNLQNFSIIFDELNNSDVLIWLQGIQGKLRTMKKYCRIIISSATFRIVYDIVIFINFIFLASSGLVSEDTINQMEDAATILLTLELVIRLIGLNILEFAGDANIILQTSITILNFFELVISGTTNDLTDQTLRLMRGTKALLFYRCLKYNKMAVKIGHIASMTFSQYIYLTFLMFLVIFMYSLIGMEMYAGEFDQTDSLGQLHSYDNIYKAFMTIFNIMTNDDWYGVYVMGSSLNYPFAIIYSYSMVIILNYITYGLFMAILLDGFGKYLDQPSEDIPKFEVEEHIQITKNSDEELEQQVYQTILSPIGSQRNLDLNDQKDSPKLKVDLIINLQKSIKALNKLMIKKPELYAGIECKTSLYIFEKDNLIRIICTNIINQKYYTLFQDFMLYASLIVFIVNTYYDYEEPQNNTCNIIQFIINLILFLDVIINVISKGLFLNAGSYFISIWQILDVIYIICDFITHNDTKGRVLNVLMYLGYLRPMKLLFRIEWLHQLRISLGQSLVDITNVFITMLSVWIMFGVYGIILYEGQFGYCDDKMNFDINEQMCIEQNRTWTNYKHNFDNITIAIPTLFVVSTLDGWGEIYQVAENSQVASIGPQPFNNYGITYVYFILFVFIGSMFFLSLFTGVLFNNLKSNQSKFIDITQSQKEFQEISQIILKDFPVFSSPPNSTIRKIASNITNNEYCMGIMFACFNIDLIVLILFTSNMSEEYFRTTNNIHNSLTIIYLIWVALLFLALGGGRFFDNYWRRFYIILLLLGLLDFFLDYSIDWIMIYFNSTPYTEGYQWMRLFFSLRSLRIILIFQGLTNLQRLMRVIGFALPQLGKIFTLLIITMLVFALIGCQLYGQIDSGAVMDDQINFRNVGQALLALFKCASGDDWRTIMTDTMQHNPNCLTDPKYCGNVNNQYFFFLFMLLSNYVLLNLFVLGLIEQFEQFFQFQNSIIQTYVENVDKIKTVWCKHSSETKGYAMNYKFLCKFLLDIGKPLGGGSDENLWDVAKLASSFNLKCDHYGYIQYNQLIYELFRRKFIQEVFREGSNDSIQKIKQYNKEMQLRLLYYRKNKLMERTNIAPGKEIKANFNILHDYLTVLILFKTWESYSKLLYQKIIKEPEYSEEDEITLDQANKQNYNDLQYLEDDDLSNVDGLTQKQIGNSSNVGGSSNNASSQLSDSKQFKPQFQNSIGQNNSLMNNSLQNNNNNHQSSSLIPSPNKPMSIKKVSSFRVQKLKANRRTSELKLIEIINQNQQQPKKNLNILQHQASLTSEKDYEKNELPYYKGQFDLSQDYKDGSLLSATQRGIFKR